MVQRRLIFLRVLGLKRDVSAKFLWTFNCLGLYSKGENNAGRILKFNVNYRIIGMVKNERTKRYDIKFNINSLRCE